jgi:hypothetical protein
LEYVIFVFGYYFLLRKVVRRELNFMRICKNNSWKREMFFFFSYNLGQRNWVFSLIIWDSGRREYCLFCPTFMVEIHMIIFPSIIVIIHLEYICWLYILILILVPGYSFAWVPECRSSLWRHCKTVRQHCKGDNSLANTHFIHNNCYRYCQSTFL